MTDFHHAFSLSLSGDLDALWPFLTPDDRTLAAIAVYRNTSVKARIDGLEANYPTISQMVGAEWFRAAALEFVEAHPGDDAVLATFGAGFPDWLATFGPALDMPYLSPVARLDRAWSEAHVAADARPLTASEAASQGLELVATRARLHPSARLFWFDWTAPSLWLAHRYPTADLDLCWVCEGEGLLIHRPHFEVEARRLTRAEWTFLEQCRKGRSFGAAALSTLSAGSQANVSSVFSDLITAGVFDSACIESATP